MSDRFEEGQANSHDLLDSKDERSIANKLAAASQKESEDGTKEELSAAEAALEPARSHGNEPSRGAKIDAQIAAEEEELLKKMDAKK